MNLLLVLSVCLLGAVELDSEPAWESVDDDFSTGGVLADIDDDGDLDLVTGNGNDMDRDPNRVYYNENDMLEETASWSSADIAFNGHISLGDMDADGDLDFAVAGFAGGGWVSDPSRVYTNDGGTFSTNPVWLGADTLHAFSCDWGDADGDGDLDLAIAAGNDYIDDKKQKVVIFKNTDGVLSAEPMWESEDADYNMDVCWVDIDGDGDLDLAAGGYETNRIYFTDAGVLNNEAGWVSADSHHTVQIAFADFDRDGDMDMATGDNGQTGNASSRTRIYKNEAGTLDTLPFWESKLWYYQSCVAWGDVDADGDLDLAAGGWWEPVSVYENVDGEFDTLPAWSWQPSDPYDLVCEQVIWGEVDNDNWKDTTESFGLQSSGDAIYPSFFPALDIVEVTIGGATAVPGEFLWNPANGWVQINKSGIVEISYRYSQFPDLLVTNWAESPGNYLFLNLADDTTTDVVTERTNLDFTLTLEKSIILRGEAIRLAINSSVRPNRIDIYDAVGRKVASFCPVPADLILPLDPSDISRGVYLMRVYTDEDSVILKFQVI